MAGAVVVTVAVAVQVSVALARALAVALPLVALLPLALIAAVALALSAAVPVALSAAVPLALAAAVALPLVALVALALSAAVALALVAAVALPLVALVALALSAAVALALSASVALALTATVALALTAAIPLALTAAVALALTIAGSVAASGRLAREGSLVLPGAKAGALARAGTVAPPLCVLSLTGRPPLPLAKLLLERLIAPMPERARHAEAHSGERHEERRTADDFASRNRRTFLDARAKFPDLLRPVNPLHPEHRRNWTGGLARNSIFFSPYPCFWTNVLGSGLDIAVLVLQNRRQRPFAETAYTPPNLDKRSPKP